MGQRLISRAEFAEYAGVSRAAVTNACNPGGQLAAASFGKRIDAAHPAATSYLRRHDVEPYPDPEDAMPANPPFPPWSPAKSAPADLVEPKAPHVRGSASIKAKRKAAATGNAPDGIPANVADFLDMPLRTIVAKFGTDVRFVDWLKAAKVIEEISGKRYANAEIRGDLIPRTYVQTHMVGAVEELCIRLLNDAPPTITSAAMEGVKAGRTKEDIEQEVQKILSKQIHTAKAKITKAVRNA